VPADPSSPIPAALAHLTDAEPLQLQDADAPHLLAYLATVPDPRAIRGAATRWPPSWPWRPPRRPDHLAVPAEAIIRRTLSRLDADALAGAICAWLADRERERPRPAASRWRAVAVDGKTLRGARTQAAGSDGRPVHLLAAMDHTTRAVLAQRQVGGAPEEVCAFQPLLDGLDPAGTVITADALQTHPEAEFLVSRKQAHYLLQVKANQPTLLARCTGLPWHRVPVLDRTRDRGHGRVELRTLKAVTVHRFGFPHAAQVLEVTRKTRDQHANPRRFTTVTVYAITSLPFMQASPARLADLLRGHWRTGPVNVAAALRRHARDPRRPLATLGISLG